MIKEDIKIFLTGYTYHLARQITLYISVTVLSIANLLGFFDNAEGADT